MKKLVTIFVLVIATGGAQEQWQNRGAEPLLKQWNNAQMSIGEALQSFLKILPGENGSRKLSSKDKIETAPSSGFVTLQNAPSFGQSSPGVYQDKKQGNIFSAVDLTPAGTSGSGYSSSGGSGGKGYSGSGLDFNSLIPLALKTAATNANPNFKASQSYVAPSRPQDQDPAGSYGVPARGGGGRGGRIYKNSGPQYGVPSFQGGSSGGYGAPSQGGGRSQQPSSEYGAPLSQTRPQGFSQTEPQYGVPPPQGSGSFGFGPGNFDTSSNNGQYGAPASGGSSNSYGAPSGSGSNSGSFGFGPGNFDNSNNGIISSSIPMPKPPRQIIVDTVSTIQFPSPIQAHPSQSYPPQPEHHNIIFVKAPAPPQIETRVILPPPQQHSTKVYVLTKDPRDDVPNIKIIPARPTKPSKPEVFFIRYAQNAPAQVTSPFNQALENIPPLPVNFDTYAPQMSHSGYNYGKYKREVPVKKTIYTLKIRTPSPSDPDRNID